VAIFCYEREDGGVSKELRNLVSIQLGKSILWLRAYLWLGVLVTLVYKFLSVSTIVRALSSSICSE